MSPFPLIKSYVKKLVIVVWFIFVIYISLRSISLGSKTKCHFYISVGMDDLLPRDNPKSLLRGRWGVLLNADAGSRSDNEVCVIHRGFRVQCSIKILRISVQVHIGINFPNSESKRDYNSVLKEEKRFVSSLRKYLNFSKSCFFFQFKNFWINRLKNLISFQLNQNVSIFS